MTLTPIGIRTSEAPIATPAPPRSEYNVVVGGSLGSSDSGTNTAIQAALPIDTPTLIANRAAWLDLDADEGSAYRAVNDLYANANVPLAFIRHEDVSARGATLAPTPSQIASMIAAIRTVPTLLDIDPRFVLIPNDSWNRDSTGGNTGSQQEGDPVAAAGTASAALTALDGVLDDLEAIAFVSVPPTAEGNPNTIDNFLAWTAANRGAHSRLVHCAPRQTVGGADDDFSGALLGTRIRIEAERGVGATMQYAPVTTAGGVPRPLLSWSGGQVATDDASRLSAAGVMAVIRSGGTLRAWGSTFAVADASSGYRYIGVRRVADEIARALRRFNLAALEIPISDRFFTFIEGHGNDYLRGLEAEGSIAAGNVVRDIERNTPQMLAAGRTNFIVQFTPVYPARTVDFRIELARAA